MKTVKNFFLAIGLTFAFYGQAQVIQGISLTNVYNNETIRLDGFNMPIAVVFTSNECPFDNYYKTRLKELITTYQGKVQFLLVNSHQDAQEAAEKMTIHYNDLGIPYLVDKEQKAMDALGARKTPEVFLLKSEDGKWAVQYSGAIDDNPQVASAVKQSFLKDAIEKVLSGGKIEIVNNRAVGCTIRKK